MLTGYRNRTYIDLPINSSIPVIAYSRTSRQINMETWNNVLNEISIVSKTTFKLPNFAISRRGRSTRNKRSALRLTDEPAFPVAASMSDATPTNDPE